jgi:hypothetical protein
MERRRASGRCHCLADRPQHQDGGGVKSSAVVEDSEIVEYRVELKIGFEYEG